MCLCIRNPKQFLSFVIFEWSIVGRVSSRAININFYIVAFKNALSKRVIPRLIAIYLPTNICTIVHTYIPIIIIVINIRAHRQLVICWKFKSFGRSYFLHVRDVRERERERIKNNNSNVE